MRSDETTYLGVSVQVQPNGGWGWKHSQVAEVEPGAEMLPNPKKR